MPLVFQEGCRCEFWIGIFIGPENNPLPMTTWNLMGGREETVDLLDVRAGQILALYATCVLEIYIGFVSINEFGTVLYFH